MMPKKTNRYKIASVILAIVLSTLACQAVQGTAVPPPTATPTNTPSAPPPTAGPTLQAPPVTSKEPFKLTGSFQWTSEIQGTFSDNILFSERQVILTDLHGFVTRDRKWELPVDSQVIGYVQYDPKTASGTYELSLPEVPQATFNDVDNNNQQDTGVQIFAVDYEPVIYGSPFEVGDDRLRGWPNNDASIKTDPN